jgi:iron complex transport system ATP-binding protein
MNNLEPAALTAPVLVVEKLVAGYASSIAEALLRDLSFALPAGHFLAVVGHNGCGKSTLLKALTGQLRPLAGQIWLNGELLPTAPAATGALAWLPQRTDVRFAIPVRELVLMGRFRRKHWYEPWQTPDYARADEALRRCGVAHLRQRDFMTLSGGEQQLVWLAQLWMQDTPLCLLDEPTQQLDVYHRRRVFDLLTDWVLAEQRTVICVTHDLANLAALSPALPALLLNLSPTRGLPQLVPLTPATVAAALAELEQGVGLAVTAEP